MHTCGQCGSSAHPNNGDVTLPRYGAPWKIVASGASDLGENAALAAALLSSPIEPSAFGTLAGAATMLKLTTGYVSLASMLLFLGAGIARTAWRKWRVTSS